MGVEAQICVCVCVCVCVGVGGGGGNRGIEACLPPPPKYGTTGGQDCANVRGFERVLVIIEAHIHTYLL